MKRKTVLQKEIDSLKWWHTIHFPEGEIARGKHDYNTDDQFSRYLLPESFAGQTVLDVGAYDGFWSVEAKKRGASHVYALDYNLMDTLKLVGKEFGLNTMYRDFNHQHRIYRSFHVVLFYGVLYHLYNPIQGIINCMQLGTTIIIETAIDTPDNLSKKPCAWMNADVWAGDDTNYFVPNYDGLIACIRIAAKILDKKFVVREAWRDNARATVKIEML
jgi:tRNA (mo5U34)-methyltransferase